jgi:hypothetical protein
MTGIAHERQLLTVYQKSGPLTRPPRTHRKVGHSIPKATIPRPPSSKSEGGLLVGSAGGSQRNQFEIIGPLPGLAPWRSSDRPCKTKLRHSERGKFINAVNGRTDEESSECPIDFAHVFSGF